MKTKYLFPSLALGLALALALLWCVGGRGSRAIAAPHSEANCDDPQPVLYLTISPTAKNGSCTSIYTLTNQGFAVATTVHDFYDQDDQLIYNMDDTLGVGASRVYDLLDVGLLLEGYSGYVIVSSDQPLTYTLDTCPVRLRACWARVNDNIIDYETVQAAVDLANEGDTVKVAGHCTGISAREGVTQVVYVSKTVTIQGGYTSTNWTTPDPDAHPTTLDAQGRGRVLYISGDVNPTIEGLRITGGDSDGLGGGWSESDAGGGIYIVTATATLSGCQVFTNTSQWTGGGVYVYQSDAVLRDNLVRGNTAYIGGGVCLYESAASLTGNTIQTNTAKYSMGGGAAGGGVYLYASDATLRNNTIRDNAAELHGGGVYLRQSGGTLERNTIFDNRASMYGGGLTVSSSDVTLNGNVIRNNAAEYGGGASLAGGTDSTGTLVNNVVTDNHAGAVGSGLYLQGSFDLLHTTIARGSGGSAFYVAGDSNVALSNTILVSHSVGISVTGGSTVTVNGVLWQSTPVTVSQSPTAVVTVQNERTGDPAFASDGYHITTGSAAIDAGVEAGVTADVDGEARPFGAGPDLGADELATVETTAEPSQASTITATVGGLTTTVEIPSQAVTETVSLKYTALATAQGSPASFAFAGSAFDLDAYQGETLLAGFAFSQPVTITLHYDETDLGGVDEETLVLDYWDGDAWVDAACGAYDRHPADDWLAAPICHLSRFALFGERREVYLPLVLRND